jgi:photosystem II stability/assembly factor-like uncharacterized protein
MRLRGNYYNDGTSGQGAMGDIRAQLYLRGSTNGVDILYNVYKCTNAGCSASTDVIPSTTVKTATVGEIHTLGIAWDGAQFTFSVDEFPVIVDPRLAQPVVNSTPNVAGKVLSAQLEIVSAGGTGFVSGDFGNVRVNNAMYDDFSGARLDPAKWGNLEIVREPAGGRLALKRAWSGAAGTYGSILQRFNNEKAVTALKGSVTVGAVQSANGFAETWMGGRFYNNGASTGSGDARGDTGGWIRVYSNNGGPLMVNFVVFCCEDAQCNWGTNLFSEDLGTINVGESHLVWVAWDGSVFTYGLDGTSRTYDPKPLSPVVKPAIQHYVAVENRAYSNVAGARAYMAAEYDAVYVNDQALVLPDLAPAYQQIVAGDVVSAGVGLRGTGIGTIVLGGIPAGATVQKAFLYWSTLGRSGTFTAPTLNGATVSGVRIGQCDDPWWGAQQAYTYRADVTPLVSGNGTFTVAGLPATGPAINDSEGASLVAIYALPGAPSRHILVNDGAVFLAGSRVSYYATTFEGLSVANPPIGSKVTFIVGDGQANTPEYAGVNSTRLATSEFSGGNGNYWDTRTYDASAAIPGGATSAEVVVSTEDDSLVWVAAILSVPLQTFALTLTTSGNGTVMSSPSGINCTANSGNCVASFAANTSITLTATATPGSTFAGWGGGACVGISTTCTLSMDVAKTVTATFSATGPIHTLTVTKAGTGNGTVTSSPAGITCGVTCSASFDYGASVTLTISPATGSTFIGWSGGGCSGTGTCTVTMDAAKTVTATFEGERTLIIITTTIAGNGTIGYSGDGGPATSAPLNYPYRVAADAQGNILIADINNHRIRKVDPAGVITTVAGTGTPGFSGDGGLATSAQLINPTDVVSDGNRNLFIADINNHRIRKVDPAGVITTVAGTGTPGFSGDGGPATSAQLHSPHSVVLDAQENLFFADAGNHRIRKVDPSGVITTVAGTGTPGLSGDGGPATSAQLNYPIAVALDMLGNLFLTDLQNHRIRKVDTSGHIATMAGTTPGFSGDGGLATSAQFSSPSGLAFDVCGNLLIADKGNNRIRRVDASGVITTVAGSGTAPYGGFSGDGGPATSAELSFPTGVTVDRNGDIFIADQNNQRIRKLWVLLGGQSAPLTVTKAGTGSGTVTSSPARITCGGTCVAAFPPGTLVTLTATPAAGSSFAGWGGVCAGTSPTCTVTMDVAKTVTATFNAAVVNYTLTVSKAGTGFGTVTGTGINCGSDCSESYTSGTAVTLTATTATGSTFTGWSGGGCSGTGTCTVTMDAAKTVTATFDASTVSYTLTVSKTGTGSGTVTATGIICGSDCSESYTSGTSVTLTAAPGGGSTFMGWAGDCSGTGTCTVNMTQARNITAQFAAYTGQPTWASICPEGGTIYTLALHPTSPNTLYAGTWSGSVFKSTDGGASWSAVNSPSAHPVLALALHPTTPSTLYAGTEGGGVFKSTDGGASWTAMNTGLTNTNVRTLALHPTTLTLYAGIDDGGVFKSTDGGASWSAANAGLTRPYVYAFALHPTSPNILYVGTDDGRVFSSTDGGASWSAVNSPSAHPVLALALHPTSPSIIYAGTYGGVFKSTDGGASWGAMNTGLTYTNVKTLALHPTTPTTLYAGTAGGGAFKSTDGGARWSALNAGLTNLVLLALALRPTTPSTLYAGTGGGVFILKESTTPTVTLRMNDSTILTGETIRLSTAISPGIVSMAADLYLAVQLPDGSLLFLQDGAGATPTAAPFKTNWNGEAFDREVFTYQFSGGEMAGTYRFLAAMMQPGTMNVLGEIVEAPFGFYPATAPPSLAILSGQWSYRTGEHLQVELSAAPSASVLDVYIAVQLPDGSLLFLHEDGSIGSSMAPWKRNWSGTPISRQVLDYAFTGGEPAGNYNVLAVFTQPGTMTFLGPIVTAPFSFAP